MSDQAPQTIDEAIQKFAGYARGENGFDELDLKEYLCDEWLPKMNQVLQTTQGDEEQVLGICYKLAVNAYNSDQPGLVDYARECADELKVLLSKQREQAQRELLDRLERLPFTDRENLCMDCTATSIVSEFIQAQRAALTRKGQDHEQI